MDLCKAAAQAARRRHDRRAVGRHPHLQRQVRLGRHRCATSARTATRSAQKIAAIEPGGRTLIFPALEQAYLALQNRQGARQARRPALRRPLVSRTTTRRWSRRWPTRGSRCRRSPSARRPTRSCCTTSRNGARDAPTCVADAKEAAADLRQGSEERGDARVRREGDQAGREDARRSSRRSISHACRRCSGRTATVIKDTRARAAATTTDDDPLLAFWPIGLGRTAVFASDVKDRWAADWVRWRGYGPFFTAVVHALERQRAPPLALDVAAGRGARRHARRSNDHGGA